MKKTFGVLLALLLVMGMLPLYTCAEETAIEEPFTMRCGIQFGDSIETVIEKDTLFADANDVKWENVLGNKYVYVQGKDVAGISNWTNIHHYYDDDRGLYKTHYKKTNYFKNEKHNKVMDTSYYSLADALTQKYGEVASSYDNELESGCKWIFELSNGGIVTISVDYTVDYADGSTTFMASKNPYYGYESIVWEYKYSTPEEVASINDDI